jgi:hypothetical protein
MRLQASLHSLRRASIGFTLTARRAGTYAAASPPAISVRVTAVIVHGSCTVTWVVHRHSVEQRVQQPRTHIGQHQPHTQPAQQHPPSP